MNKKTSSKKKTKRKVAKKKSATKKKITKRRSFDDIPPSMQEFNGSPASPWPWPLRPMQQQAYDAMQSGIDRLGLFWHRRAGKDIFGMSVARDQMRKRIGSYVHFFPKHVHAKRALWRGIDPRMGKKFIDIAFGDMEVARNNQEMTIDMFNGSSWTLLGSDNYDSTVVGGNVVGVVFSEWALCNPNAWDYIRPILRENNGWAIFITTFRGRNHAWQMANNLKDNPDWYIDIRTIEQTQELDGSPIISLADVEKDRRDGMKDSLIQQEYFCDPQAVIDGAIYGRQIGDLQANPNRHRAVWTPDKPTHCVWNIDLPLHASYVVTQPGDVPRILDAGTCDFTTLPEAIAKAEQQSFPITNHILMGEQREIIPHFNDLRRHPEILSNKNKILENVSTSTLLQKCDVDYEKCELLIDAVSGYVRQESFSSQLADIRYSQFPAASWHTQLSYALETAAAWEYHSGNDKWSKAPNYDAHDRIARTIL